MSHKLLNNNILVTGGAGYIGSHTCKMLARQGYTPIVYDNFVYGHKSAVRWGPYVEGDIHDTALLSHTFQKYQVGGVIHFAAYAYVGESVQNPQKYYENNVLGSMSLLQAMRDSGLSQIVFSSTCATYGIPEATPIEESCSQKPINPYGQTKLIVEHILKDYGAAYGLKSVALRYFNASGASPDSEIGENHNPETHLIPLALQSALTGSELKVFGTDYPTPDGTCLRDYIHVDDLASAHILAYESLSQQKLNFEFYNLGTEKAHSVQEVLKSVESLSGKKVNAIYTERRAGDPALLVANSQKAQKQLLWAPQYLDLDQIIETAYRWELKKLQNNLQKNVKHP